MSQLEEIFLTPRAYPFEKNTVISRVVLRAKVWCDPTMVAGLVDLRKNCPWDVSRSPLTFTATEEVLSQRIVEALLLGPLIILFILLPTL